MQDSEHVLVDQLRHKDKGAFELVFNKYYSFLKAYAFRFVETPEEADEITQEVFVRFWDKCEELEPGSSIKSYLYRSVHNTSLNHVKHLQVKSAYREQVIQAMDQSVSDDNTESNHEEIQKRIRDEIEKLPPRCSEIFKLSRFEGLKYQEISDYLKISVKTVEVQMGKAFKTLRENLQDLQW